MHFDGEVLAWVEGLQRQHGRHIPLLSPKPGRPVSGIVLSELVTMVEVHHTPRGSRPCRTDRQTCPLCRAGNNELRVKGYVAAWSASAGREILLELTAESMSACSAIKDRQPLRGRTLTLTRLGAAPNSRVSARLSENRTEGTLPAACNVREVLCRVWFGGKRKQQEEGANDE
jgi:hypothetical protein